jgi:lipopolysaccharide cholinephosphotransferase
MIDYDKDKDKYIKYKLKNNIISMHGGNKESPECLSNDDKKNFLNKINNFYNYGNQEIEMMMNEKYLICNRKLIENIDMIDNDSMNSIKKLLRKLTKYLISNNIEYWLDGGTLLGAVRNHKFIPWDDDADIGITEDMYEKLLKIVLKLPKKTIDGNVFYVDKNNKMKFEIMDNAFAVDKTKNFFIIKAYSYKSKKINKDVFVDIIIYFLKNGRYISNSTRWENVYYYKEEDMFPLKKILFEGKKYYIVNNPINYLNNGYYFWKHLGVAHHSHFKHLKKTRNKNLYFVLEPYDEEYKLFNK